eukprot:TRINITY_DN37125_c4_g1_i1.p1 TRINITY_DN37125_c4_g1~~TRINITY_DN37125_c4_g1_i1.p1  ORF type:complete len:110 (-),score=13.24 TRINITY_DN37125_c4_g1_i1:150-479(-)
MKHSISKSDNILQNNLDALMNNKNVSNIIVNGCIIHLNVREYEQSSYQCSTSAGELWRIFLSVWFVLGYTKVCTSSPTRMGIRLSVLSMHNRAFPNLAKSTEVVEETDR